MVDINDVLIKKDSLCKNIPNQDTYVSLEHKIFFQKSMTQAKNLVNGINVVLVPYNREPLFNVLLNSHQLMLVNNMIVETLHPDNLIAQVYDVASDLTVNERNVYFREINRQTQLRHVYQQKSN